MTIEQTVLSHLLRSEKYARQVLPYLKPDYFASATQRAVFSCIATHMTTYNTQPTKEIVFIDFDKEEQLGDEQHKEGVELIKALKAESCDEQWLLDMTEKFCQDKALYNGIMTSISILDGKDKKRGKGAIPEIMSDALGVSFDANIGHDYFADTEKQWKYYHDPGVRVPFDLEYFNKITKGGFKNKTLNIFMGGVGVGKSLVMCHMAAMNLYAGLDVLYITLELSEEQVTQRIDTNLLNEDIDVLETWPKDVYDKKTAALRARTPGRLIIKEYPTAQAGAANFRHLLYELKLKSRFIPKIIYIDYLNLCISSRIKYGSTVNSYTYVKAISEEIRGLAVEMNVPIVSATQLNREGFSDSDPDMDQVAESFGLPAAADFMAVIVSSEELEKLNQFMVKQLKSRYRNFWVDRKFVIGVDKNKMRLYDCEQTAQDLQGDDEPSLAVQSQAPKLFD